RFDHHLAAVPRPGAQPAGLPGASARDRAAGAGGAKGAPRDAADAGLEAAPAGGQAAALGDEGAAARRGRGVTLGEEACGRVRRPPRGQLWRPDVSAMIYLIAILLSLVVCWQGVASGVTRGNITHLKAGRLPNAGVAIFPVVPVVQLV